MEDPPVIEDTTGIQIIWHTKFDTIEPYGSYLNAYRSPIVHKNQIIFIKRSCLSSNSSCNYKGEIKSFDKRTGETLWSYDIDDAFNGVIAVEKTRDDQLVLLMGKGIVGFDLQSREVLWKTLYNNVVTDGGRGGFSIAIFDEVGVISIDQGSSPWPDAYYLYKFDLTSGVGEIMYEIQSHEVEGEGVLTFHLGASAVHRDRHTGDEKLIFRVGTSGPNATINSPTRLYSYNVTADSLEWKSPSYTTLAPFAPQEPIIYGDWVFMSGDVRPTTEERLYKFDIATGNILDSLTMIARSGFGTSQYLEHKGKLYLNAVSEEMYCIGPERMQVIWEIQDGSATACLNSVIHEDVWFINSGGEGSLYAIDAFTGEILDEFEPSSLENFRGADVAVDPETGILYTQNYRNAIALKFNRE